jgi:2,3-bisphosphoglycerate-dependent phosphoglycerate mutase
MERAIEVVKKFESTEFKCIAMVMNGNLMTLLLKHFDTRSGFNEWAEFTNPDVFLIDFGENSLSTQVDRLAFELMEANTT